MSRESKDSNDVQLEDFSNMIIAPFKVIGHEHPLIFCFPLDRRTKCDGWTCNKCNKDYNNKIPSFYCTYCDYDICQYCIGRYQLNQFKLNLTEQINNAKNINKFTKNEEYEWNKKYPSHKHALVLIGRINKYTTWNCNECKKSFRNIDPSLYCSLCDYDICLICYNGKTNSSEPKKDKKK